MKYNSAPFDSVLAISRRFDGGVVELRQSERKMQDIGTAGSITPETTGATVRKVAFRDEAEAMIGDVRRHLLAMLEAGGRQIIKSRDVQKLYGVDASLSWQVFKLFNAKDLLSASQFVPPAVSMQKIFVAARKRGIEDALIASASSTFERFEAFVEKHAGGRGRFESMTAGLSQGEDVKQAAEQQRKLLFKAHTFYWGVELNTMYNLSILNPNNKGMCDLVHVGNILGFHRLRPDADTLVVGTGSLTAPGENSNRPPLDADALAAHGVAVLPEFSTAALPLLRTDVDHWGRSRTVLTGGDVGLTSSVDLAFGSVMENLEPLAGEPFSHRCNTVIIRPTERLYAEILVPRAVYPRLKGVVKLYGHVSVGAAPQDFHNPAWELPIYETVTHEKSINDARLVGVPRRRELIEHCCNKMGWDARDFDVYRLQVDFPIVDTNTVMILGPAE